MLGQMGGRPGGGQSQAIPDSSETIIISSLALLKMLKHGRAGIPMEVMGLMLGSFIGRPSSWGLGFVPTSRVNDRRPSHT